MALPGTTTTTSVIGTTITGAFNQRDVEMKERLKLKLTKRNLTEQQISTKDQQKKDLTTNKKPTIQNNSKTKEFSLNDKNDIDDLVRFIDGNETISTNNNEHQTSTVSSSTTTTNETTSKKNKKKKDKQTKTNNEENKTNTSQTKEQQQINQKKQNGTNTIQSTTYVLFSD
jgi:hypothetical protein